MDTEPPRLALALSALAGAAVWGTFHLVTTLWAGQPVARADQLRALANVAAALLVGALCAYFVGPAVADYVPLAGLRDPHVVGFGIGMLAWEAAPFFFSWARLRAKRIAKEKR
jgi:MFS family permease